MADSIPFVIAFASWSFWLGFCAVVAAFLALDGWLASRRTNGGQRWWISVLVVIAAAAGFAVWLAFARGRQPALEFAAGYAVELSLSIDNLFVFMVLFQGFGIGPERQERALVWGVGGAVVLRAVFIGAGIALLDRFQWLTWALGCFLLYTGWRLARGRSMRATIPQWIRRWQSATSSNCESTQPGASALGSLLPIILAIELTDLAFAADSIPAVLAITRNPLVAYTSNIAAVLCLRSLYLGLARMLGRFRYLHYGLAGIVAFVGIKMLITRWIEVPVIATLAVIGGIMAACAAGGLSKKPAQE